MSIGKITGILLTAAGCAGIATSIIGTGHRNTSENRAYIQQLEQDVYAPAKTFSPEVVREVNTFCQDIDLHNNNLSKNIRELMEGQSFSNPKFYVKPDLQFGHIVFYNCNMSDIAKMRELLQIDKKKEFSFFESNNTPLHAMERLKHKCDSHVSFNLCDIGNPKVKTVYDNFVGQVQNKLRYLLDVSSVSYNANNVGGMFVLTQSKEKPLFLKQVLPLFNSRTVDMTYVGKHNPWIYNLFTRYSKPVKEAVNVPYANVIAALKRYSGISAIKKVMAQINSTNVLNSATQAVTNIAVKAAKSL